MNDVLPGFLSSTHVEACGRGSSVEEATLVFKELLEDDFTRVRIRIISCLQGR